MTERLRMSEKLELLMPSSPQTVVLKGDGVPHSLHRLEVSVYSSECNDSDTTDGSGKVRVSTITNQNWEPKCFHGNIVASNSRYLAYVLDSRTGYVIRLIHLSTKDRALIKKFTGKILDISFPHKSSNLLGAIDEGGNLYVYDIDKTGGDLSKIGECLKLYIFNGSLPDGKSHRLVWCPYVEQQLVTDGDDENQMIAISHDTRVEVFDLPEIALRYSSGIALDFKKMERGTTFIRSAHTKSVTDMAFSPDGNVLATCSDDGFLKFWELNHENEETVKCLHEHQPDNGSHITRLLFLDNLVYPETDAQFWRFLVTGSNDNSVIKIWCTVKWKPLHTIRFLPPLGSTDEVHPRMIINIDSTASYLTVADSMRNVLYVLPIRQDPSIGEASFSSITEYILTQPILSFVLSGHTPLSNISDSSEEEEEEEVFNPKRNSVVLQLHCIQTRSMQELLVTFDPPDITGIPPPTSDGSVVHTTPPSLVSAVPPPISLESSQYGPSQSSPAVKLMSPVSFLSLPSDSVSRPNDSISRLTDPVLRSPSDFTNITSPLSPVSSGSGLLVTPPIVPDSAQSGELIINHTSETSFPSALVGGAGGVAWNNDIVWEETVNERSQEEKEEEEWPLVDVIQSNDEIRRQAIDIISSVLDTAIATVNKSLNEEEEEEEEEVKEKEQKDEEKEEECDEVMTEEGNDDLLLRLINQLLIQQGEIKEENDIRMRAMMSHIHEQLEATNRDIMTSVREQLKEHNQKIEKLIKSNEIKRNDKILQSLSQSVQSSVAGRLEKSVKNETKNSIIPAIHKSLSSTQEGITRSVNEHLHQILHTEGLIQAIANAVAGVMPHVLPVIMETLFKNTLLPSIERSCQNMFRQLDEAFRQGTSEYLSQLQDQQGRSLDSSMINQISSTLQSLVNSFNSSSSPLVPLIQTSLHTELSVLLPRLQDSIKESIAMTMKDELLGALEERSSSHNQQQQEKITALLEAKDYDTAFNLALSTSNLNLVMYLCNHVSPEEVFDSNTQCPLTQPVLLSLIQQITVDLTDNVELKVKYIEQSILSLDPHDPVTSAHLPTVMTLLAEQLTKTEERMRAQGLGSASFLRTLKSVRMLSEHVYRSSSGKL